MQAGILSQIIYWLSTPVFAALAGLLLWRKLWREFPLFFTYVAFALLDDLVRGVAYSGSAKTYLYTYWFTDLVGSVFMFLATYELFMKRLFPRFHRVGFYRYLFSIAAAIGISLAILAATGNRRFAMIAYVIRTLDFLRVAVLFFFVALMLFMGRLWSRYEFGIALGLGVNAAAFLITFAIFVKSGPLHGAIRDLPVFGTDAASLIWLITFLRPEKSTAVPTVPVSPEVLEQAKKWEETLKESVTGKKHPQ